MWMKFFLVVAVLGVASCRTPRSETSGPGLNPKRESALLEIASRELNCDREQLAVTYVDSIERNAHIYRADGCQKTYEA
jgi:hypothetical protein